MTAKPKRASPNVTLAVLSLGALAYAVLSGAVIPALPTFQHDLHASVPGLQWTVDLITISERHIDNWFAEHLVLFLLI